MPPTFSDQLLSTLATVCCDKFATDAQVFPMVPFCNGRAVTSCREFPCLLGRVGGQIKGACMHLTNYYSSS
jgi:hypothetical protein